MIVVADTSVLLNLAFLGLDGLLQDLFGEVLFPGAVAVEFSRMSASSGRFGGLVMPLGCKVRPAPNLPPAISADASLDIAHIPHPLARFIFYTQLSHNQKVP